MVTSINRVFLASSNGASLSMMERPCGERYTKALLNGILVAITIPMI
jgi:hypothetical protein